MGTDYPFPWTKTAVDHILATLGLSDGERVAILEETAEKLLAVKPTWPSSEPKTAGSTDLPAVINADLELTWAGFANEELLSRSHLRRSSARV